jgi:hypothetical protein
MMPRTAAMMKTIVLEMMTKAPRSTKAIKTMTKMTTKMKTMMTTKTKTTILLECTDQSERTN